VMARRAMFIKNGRDVSREDRRGRRGSIDRRGKK
jgi:hypothetical protein